MLEHSLLNILQPYSIGHKKCWVPRHTLEKLHLCYGYAVEQAENGELNRKLEDAEKKVDQLQDSVQRFVIILEVISTPIC